MTGSKWELLKRNGWLPYLFKESLEFFFHRILFSQYSRKWGAAGIGKLELALVTESQRL